MERRAFLKSIVGWLRAGYPDGVPERDYVPLLALLRRRITDDELTWVADQITREGNSPFGTTDIGVVITKVTDELPHEDDLERVRAHLVEGGWEVDPPLGHSPELRD